VTAGFHFMTQYSLVELLGLKATNPSQLLAGIRSVPVSSIYYHTHRFLQLHNYLSPEPPNDFAFWLKDILHLEELGEAFLSIDTISFNNLEDLRSKFVEILGDYFLTDGNIVDCPKGYEFYFMGCQTFVLPTPYIANNIKEFSEILSKISVNSLYFHIFEARMRLGIPENDFSVWLRGVGQDDLAKEISKLDPYNITLENLRKKIMNMVTKHAQN
jgi:hypothetical protein